MRRPGLWCRRQFEPVLNMACSSLRGQLKVRYVAVQNGKFVKSGDDKMHLSTNDYSPAEDFGGVFFLAGPGYTSAFRLWTSRMLELFLYAWAPESRIDISAA